MNVSKWINRNRLKIDEYTKSQYKNDSDRRLWVLNDEFLYNQCRFNHDL